MLNNKQRDILAGSVVKIAEYLIVILIIGQAALERFNFLNVSASLLIAGIIYTFSLYILREYREGK